MKNLRQVKRKEVHVINFTAKTNCSSEIQHTSWYLVLAHDYIVNKAFTHRPYNLILVTALWSRYCHYFTFKGWKLRSTVLKWQSPVLQLISCIFHNSMPLFWCESHVHFPGLPLKALCPLHCVCLVSLQLGFFLYSLGQDYMLFFIYIPSSCY